MMTNLLIVNNASSYAMGATAQTMYLHGADPEFTPQFGPFVPRRLFHSARSYRVCMKTLGPESDHNVICNGITMAKRSSLPVIKGTLDVLVLKALTWSAMHGFEITAWLEDRSGGVLEVEDSALYQALYRLEERGLVEAKWGVTENNRRARYYQITRAGRGHLQEESIRLTAYAATLADILALRPNAG